MVRSRTLRALAVFAALGIVAAACGDDSSSSSSDQTTTTAESEEGGNEEGPVRTLDAPVATINVDGDAAEWDGIEGLDMTLEPIDEEKDKVDPIDAHVKVAHDDQNVYVLLQVDDDYDFNPDDGHLSSAAAVMWGVEPDAAEHMGAEEDDLDTSLGLVDIWHWELGCEAGVESGGSVSGPGDGDPGNDNACNFDDEWATTPEDREDDNADGAENSLLGVWTHSNPVEDGDGTWTFEMSRPLDTGDSQDAVLSVGETARMAVAYWDSDFGPDGWDDDTHVQSANQGWIEVTLAG